MEVTVIRPLCENLRDYKPDDKISLTPSRGWRLAELGLVEAPPPVAYTYRDEWAELRKLIGARPSGIVAFATRRSRLDMLKPGEKLLILRKYGGLGDILISSMIFPMLAEQYPHVQVTYACPRQYHTLFEGTGLRLSPYEDVFASENTYHRGNVRPEFLEQYDLIEDISIPCHVWETIFTRYGGSTEIGGNGFKWRNRLDMWCNWIGVTVRNPRTNVIIREEERAAARKRIINAVGSGKPVCIIAPFSGNSIKCYPWFEQVGNRLQADGWGVALLYSKTIPRTIPIPSPVPRPIPTIAGLSIREMGAVCAVPELLISVDTSAFHWGGALGTPTLGIFNINDGATYAEYYPTAQVAQVCDTPCLMSKYAPNGRYCSKHTKESLPLLPGLGVATSPCYPSASVGSIMDAVKAFSKGRR